MECSLCLLACAPLAFITIAVGEVIDALAIEAFFAPVALVAIRVKKIEGAATFLTVQVLTHITFAIGAI